MEVLTIGCRAQGLIRYKRYIRHELAAITPETPSSPHRQDD
jgi:hypothetical protein